MDRDEITCHAVGERRQNYLNQIRCILEQMDDRPCARRTGGERKPLIEYPGYVNTKRAAKRWKTDPNSAPMIVNVPIRELRPTSEYWKHSNENNDKLQYYSVGERPKKPYHSQHLSERKKSQELIAGWIVSGCDCARHNGLQDDCKRSECQSNPKCRTNPPSCGPSSTYRSAPNLDLEAKFEEVIRANRPKKKFYCCCEHDGGPVDPRTLPRGFEPFPCRHH